LNSRPSPWQGDALPLSYSRLSKKLDSNDWRGVVKRGSRRSGLKLETLVADGERWDGLKARSTKSHEKSRKRLRISSLFVWIRGSFPHPTREATADGQVVRVGRLRVPSSPPNPLRGRRGGRHDCGKNAREEANSYCGKGVFSTPVMSSFNPTSELSCRNL
jgi:hypothetical protein